MTQEEKSLLLQDLCARLPYGVICKVKYIINNETTFGEDIERECNDIVKRINFDNYTIYTEWLRIESYIEDVKPYLRPLSSMTEDEFYEYNYIRFSKVKDKDNYKRINIGKFHNVGIIPIEEYSDWLNANQFDYRDLISKGLALKASKNMYKNETI